MTQLLLEVTASLSEFANIPVGKQAQEMDISPAFQPYSGVEIIVSEDTAYFAGNRSGRVLQIENPWGTQTQANNILASLTQSGFQYQPYTANNALVNPAAELGDAVTVNGTYSGIYKMSRNYSPLMAADIEAPQDEEVDHEYPFEPKQDRIYKREIADARAQIKVNHDSIEAEVIRASEAEGTLRSSITQNATAINAKVSQTGGNNSSFGWSLTSSAFDLYSGGTMVFRATSSGVEISGKITAKSGYIGNGSNGFTITASAIYNGMNSINSTTNGVYIGTNGIALGGGAFKVTSSGSVSAKDMTLTGTLNIGGTKITAAALRSGAQSAYNNSATWSTGAGYGRAYNSATGQNTSTYPAYFSCGTLTVWTGIVSKGSFSNGLDTTINNTGFYIGGKRATWQEKTVVTGVTATGTYPVYTTTGSIVYPPTSINVLTGKIYYLGR